MLPTGSSSREKSWYSDDYTSNNKVSSIVTSGNAKQLEEMTLFIEDSNFEKKNNFQWQFSSTSFYFIQLVNTISVYVRANKQAKLAEPPYT
jgi:hypothetical protein